MKIAHFMPSDCKKVELKWIPPRPIEEGVAGDRIFLGDILIKTDVGMKRNSWENDYKTYYAALHGAEKGKTVQFIKFDKIK